MKNLKTFVVLLLVAAVVAAFGVPTQALAGGKAITSAEDGVAVAATRPWTAEEMRAAIPYPMPEFDGALPSAGIPAGPDGPAGFKAGSQGGGAPLFGADDLGGADPLAFSYPAPFTRLYVHAIAPYTTYPFSAIGKLFFKQYGVSYVCSASAIGLRGIVTAGHCVHKGNNLSSGWSTNVVFVPAYRAGAAPYGQWAVTVLRTFTDWYARGTLGDFDHDWGAGNVPPIQGISVGSRTGYLGYAWNFSAIQDWWLLGYPAAAPFTGAYMTFCTAGYAYNSPFYSGGPAPMTVGCDMTGGCSGGPWVKNFGSGNYVNGVNSHRATARPQELSSPYANTDTKTAIFDWARSR